MMFKFELGQKVAIEVNQSEKGKVIGRADYCIGENIYYVRYVNGQGIAAEMWWPESSLICNEPTGEIDVTNA